MKITEFKNEILGDSVFQVKHPSGLTILVNTKEGYSSAYAIFGTKYGSIDTFVQNDEGGFDEIPEGTAHFLEHKLFECEEMDAFARFTKTGASANAYTSFDRTAYLFRCNENFEESLGILIDFVQKPYFTEETVQKEQGIIGQEIRMYKDSADWELMINLMRALYEKCPVRIDIAGTQESIAKINADLLYRLYDNFYDLSNMVLCVCGNVDVDTVVKVVDKSIVRKATGKKVQRRFEYESPIPKEKYVEEKMQVATTDFLLGYKEDLKKPEVSLDDEMASRIAVEAICGKSSPLFARLLSEGLIDMGFGGEYFRGFGYSCCMFGGTTKDVDRTVSEIRKEIKKLVKTGLDEEVFERARRKLYGRMVMCYNEIGEIADGLMDLYFSGNKPFAEIEACKNITLERVNKRLKKLNDKYSAVSVTCPVGEVNADE